MSKVKKCSNECIENGTSPFLFIFGPQRSGTTLLTNLFMLSDHVSSTPNDFDLLRIHRYALGQNDKNSSQRKKLQEWGITKLPIIDCFLNNNELPTNEFFSYVVDPIAILRSVLISYFESNKKPLMIHKTPKSEQYLETYRQAFPGSRFIFIIRNPIAIMASRKFWKISNRNLWVNLDPKNKEIEMETASSSMAYISYHLKSIFESFKIIDEAGFLKETFDITSYEKLVKQTKGILTSYSKRLGIEFNFEEIQELTAPYTSYKEFRKTKGIYTTTIDVWKTKLSRMEIIIIYNELKKFLKEYKFKSETFKKTITKYKIEIEDFLN